MGAVARDSENVVNVCDWQGGIWVQKRGRSWGHRGPRALLGQDAGDARAGCCGVAPVVVYTTHFEQHRHQWQQPLHLLLRSFCAWQDGPHPHTSSVPHAPASRLPSFPTIRPRALFPGRLPEGVYRELPVLQPLRLSVLPTLTTVTAGSSSALPVDRPRTTITCGRPASSDGRAPPGNWRPSWALQEAAGYRVCPGLAPITCLLAAS